MELIPAIRERLAELDVLRREARAAGRRDARVSGQRAAMWRAQQHAARIGRSVDDLRRYCLDALERRRYLDEDDENDYLRGYREGFQAVLREIRRVETRARRR